MFWGRLLQQAFYKSCPPRFRSRLCTAGVCFTAIRSSHRQRFFSFPFFLPPHFFSRHGTAAVAIFRLPWGRIPQLPTREPEASRIKTPAQTATDRVQLTECCQPSCLACRAHHPLPCRGKIGRAFLYCWSCATKFLPFLTPCLFVPVGWWGLAVLISSTYLLFFYLLASCLLINCGFF